MGYETRQLAKTFGVDPMTIRNWAADYAEHLSADAVPGKGKTRSFTEDDFMILALVAELRKHKLPDMIHVALRAGERASIPLLNPQEIDDITAHRQVESLQNKVQEITEERDKLFAKVEEYEKDILPLKTENAALAAEKVHLVRELAEIKAKLAGVEQQLFENYAKGIERGLKINLKPPKPAADAPPEPAGGQGAN